MPVLMNHTDCISLMPEISAFATVGNAIFLTTDDHIITTVMKNPHPGLIVHNPVKWLMEVNDEDYQ